MPPLFVVPPFTHGDSLGWVFGGGPRVPARIQGRVWRLPNGDLVLTLDPEAGWVWGELVDGPRPGAESLLRMLLGASARSLERLQTHARVGSRAVAVETWAGQPAALERMGALRLRSGEPGRLLRDPPLDGPPPPRKTGGAVRQPLPRRQKNG
jgi:hypothetical protein